MATRTKATPKNGGRATIRDILSAVSGLNERIDGVSARVDQTLTGQQDAMARMATLHDAMHDLRQATNHRLHTMEADVARIKRPLTLLTTGWAKVVGVSTAAAAVSGAVARLELWRFIPGL